AYREETVGWSNFADFVIAAVGYIHRAARTCRYKPGRVEQGDRSVAVSAARRWRSAGETLNVPAIRLAWRGGRVLQAYLSQAVVTQLTHNQSAAGPGDSDRTIEGSYVSGAVHRAGRARSGNGGHISCAGNASYPLIAVIGYIERAVAS